MPPLPQDPPDTEAHHPWRLAIASSLLGAALVYVWLLGGMNELDRPLGGAPLGLITSRGAQVLVTSPWTWFLAAVGGTATFLWWCVMFVHQGRISRTERRQ